MYPCADSVQLCTVHDAVQPRYWLAGMEALPRIGKMKMPREIGEAAARRAPFVEIAGHDGACGGVHGVDAAQYAAGQRFGRDVASAQLLPRVTSDWSGQVRAPGAGPRNLTPSEMAVAARQRLDRAANALGAELANLLIDVCGFQKRLELVERERAWPARAGKLVLRIALDRLADHYGLASMARGPERDGRIRRWGASDYRPSVD